MSNPGPALPADAKCGVHVESTAAFACARCGTYACPECAGGMRARRPVCVSCAAKDPLRTVWWQGTAVLVVGGIGAQIAGAIALVVAAAIGAFSGGGPGLDGLELSFGIVAPSVVVTGLAMAAFAFALPLLTKVPSRVALGIRGAPWPAFVAGPIGIIALGPTSDAFHRLMVEIAPGFTFGTLDDLDAIAKSAPLWAVVPLLALVPGICEELLFRGAFQRSIRTRWIAIVLSGFLFALYHFDPHHVVAVVPLGFYLAWLGDRTDSLLVPISAHVTNNAVAVIASVTLGSAAESTANDWWYVPVGWVVAAIAIAVVWWSTRRRAEPVPAVAPALS